MMNHYHRALILLEVCLLALFIQHASAYAQLTPLGFTVVPEKPVAIPVDLRKQIPKRSVVRVFREINLGGQEESLLVYDRGAKYGEYRPHVAIVVSGRVITDVDLAKHKEAFEYFTVITAVQFQLTATQNGLALAFQSHGDGAGFLFVVMMRIASDYRPILMRHTTQGRLVITQGQNSSLDIWSAAEEEECAWCRHLYTVETMVFGVDKFRSVRRRRTKSTYDPLRIIANPIVVH